MTEGKTGPLLDWLLEQYPDTPKTRAKQWILAGRVTVNGVVVRKPHQVMADPGATLQLGDRRATTIDCGTGWPIHPRVTLLYLDGDLAVVNKGAGLISVPAAKPELSALSILTDFLCGKLVPRNREVAAKSLPPAFRRIELLPVHRLDQYTSGVFCMACNPSARQRLIAQLQSRTMKREYIAFAQGRPGAASGVWRHWMQLNANDLRQNIITEAQAKNAGDAAREAITHFEALAEYPLADGKGVVTKLRLRLESGLKHQIRLQAAEAGCPLIGDRTYNPDYLQFEFPRQALHAETLELEHPARLGTRLKWMVQLPTDLRELVETLKADSRG